MDQDKPKIDKRIYQELRTIAARLIRKERRGYTLQATELVGEAFLRVRKILGEVQDERHLFGLCCRAMKQVLMDRARVRKGRERLAPLVSSTLKKEGEGDSVAERAELAAAVEELGRKHRLVAETLCMRFVEGFSVSEVGQKQGRPDWRIRGDLDFGTYQLQKILKRSGAKR